jgi:predicted amidohydrolase
MIVGAVAWEITPVTNFQEFSDRFSTVVASADLDWIVFPECFILELCGLRPELQGPDMVRFISEFSSDFEALVSLTARENKVTITAGSHFSPKPSGIVHLSLTVDPNGRRAEQPKNVMTQFEVVDWGLSGSQGIVPLPDPRLGSLVCYDCEFPISARNHAENGVLAVAVPAFTETQRGFQRVRWSCQARAIENQIFMIHASLLGHLNGEPVPTTFGSSAILAPSVAPFPESAILAETELNLPGIAIAKLDFQLLHESRESDDVRNWHDRNASDFRIIALD